MIDLSSDTATRPTQAMREFMAKAPVGDEQRREDPTVNALQDTVAELTGKEAALFVPSGTMCNAIAFTVHCQRGEAVILDRHAHPNTSEAGGPAVLAGVLMRTVDTERGIFTPEQAAAEAAQGGTHVSRTAMISVENTTNRGGGACWPIEHLAGLREVANQHGMIMHMDGARLMNAVVATGISAREYASHVDSVWIDLSKGLGAPVGGVLAGSRDFIEKGRIWKHRLGGAMRQAGVIAAAGLYAFENHVERLAEDHANAKFLEAGLQQIPGIKLVWGPVETNIIFLDIADTGLTAAEFQSRIEAKGVRMSSPYVNGTLIRALTHLDVTRTDCEVVLDVVRAAVA